MAAADFPGCAPLAIHFLFARALIGRSPPASALTRPRCSARLYRPLQPFDGIVQVHVADEADCVDDGVRDREWQHSAGPLEPPAEDDAHHHVPEESTEALIQ